MRKKKRTKEEIERIIAKGFPKDREERIRKFQEWCKNTQPNNPCSKEWRFP